MTILDNTEGLVLWGLIYNKEYQRKVLPFLKDEYFQEHCNKIIFNKASQYIIKYNSAPSKEALIIEIEQERGISDKAFTECNAILLELYDNKDRDENIDYLVDLTEKWVQDSAFFNVLMEATEVVDGDKGKISKSGIPDKMSQALSITFDNSIGHDFISDAQLRYDFYHKKESRVRFNLDLFNKVTKGGLPTKTLTCLMSSNTGGFKSGTMCSLAADNMRNGDDCLYITCELSEERVAERIDANLMGIDLDDIAKLGHATYMKKIEDIKHKCIGKLKIKEYPPTSAHAGHFRFLLKELKQKHNFVPKIIYIDYLNICASQRLPASASANSYLYIKSIAEELRGLAVEFNVPVFTATQGGRQVANASNVEISDVSESYGLTATCDIFLGIITTEELDSMKHIMFKQLKNRFGDININKMFIVSANKAQMRLSNIENTITTNKALLGTQESTASIISNKFAEFKM